MITVGLTGNVASGKTAVADRWRNAGVKVIDADALGHEVLRDDADAQRALIDAFGSEIRAADGSIDRRRLGDLAFGSQSATATLNGIVHPPLLSRLDAEIDAARRSGVPIVVVEAALMFEFGFDTRLDRIVLITAPRVLRAQRLRDQREMSDDLIDRVMAAQTPDIEKVDRCHYVVVNDGSLEELFEKADVVLADLKRVAADTRGDTCAE